MRLYSIIFAAALLLFAGCRDMGLETEIPVDGETEFTFSLNVPAVTIATKAMSPEDENRLSEVDILVFEETPEGEFFAYRTYNRNSLDATSDVNTVRALFRLSKNGEKYRAVILGNLRSEVNRVLYDDHCEGLPKEELLSRIYITHESRWPARDDVGYRPIPMWGEASQTTEIVENMPPSSFGGTVPMLRGLARIQLSVSVTDEQGVVSSGMDFFTIEEIKVYNARKHGRAVPAPENLDAQGKAEQPTLVTGSRTIPSEDMVYVLSDLDPNHDNRLTNSIYVNEALNKGAETMDAMFLIIKAYYTEEGEAQKNTDRATYYRVDFMEDEDTRKNILRNHSYHIVITEITGPGYEDEETAARSVPQDLKTSITDWSDGEMKYVVFSGAYYLAVSESTVVMPRPDDRGKFYVKTNYPNGWTATVSEGGAWLGDLSPDFSTNLEVSEPLSFHVSENDTGVRRSGKIAISCGTVLTLDVVIEQTHEEQARIWFREFLRDDSEVETESPWNFISGVPQGQLASRMLKVYWTPQEKDLVFYTDMNNEFKWGSMSLADGNFQSVYTGGEQGIVIVPESMGMDNLITEDNLFPRRSTDLKFWVPGEETVEATFKIVQQHMDAYAYPDLVNGYEMNGEKYSFKIKSNTTWAVSATGNYTNMIEILTPSGGNHPEGEDFEFIIKEDTDNIGSGIITLYVTHDDMYGIMGRRVYSFPIYSVPDPGGEARQGQEANCYILDPDNAEGVVIPVKRANADGTQRIADNEELSWKFIWTDHPGGLDPSGNSSVRAVKLDGRGPDATLTVYPGSQAGNAVVAVTSADGSTIYWSWHIWVTHFDPNELENIYENNGFVFMDRNLGSHIDDGNDGYKDPSFWGLFYQWGRKDPYPQAAAVGSEDHRPIYDEDGNPLHMAYETLPTGQNNLEYSIRNPLTYINPYNATTGDWYHSVLASRNDKLWSDGVAKTVYDPCPEGWRVPEATTDWGSAWSGLNTWPHSNSYDPTNLVIVSTKLGYWPLAGMINKNNNGTYSNVGEGGVYWSALPNTSSGKSIASYWTNAIYDKVETTSATSRGAAAAIRCVRE